MFAASVQQQPGKNFIELRSSYMHNMHLWKENQDVFKVISMGSVLGKDVVLREATNPS